MPLSGEGEYAHVLVLKHTLTDNTPCQSFKKREATQELDFSG